MSEFIHIVLAIFGVALMLIFTAAYFLKQMDMTSLALALALCNGGVFMNIRGIIFERKKQKCVKDEGGETE